MKNRNSIFDSDNEKRRSKDSLKSVRDLGKNSGYLHDWKQHDTKRRNEKLKKLALFGGAVALTVIITVFVNVQNLNDIRKQREEFLAQITPAPTQVVERATPVPVEFSDEFARSLQLYEDTVAYLKIEDTNIDYPIVQGEDNYFFENRNYDRSYSEIAATYMLSECDIDTTRHIIIYGENEDIDNRFGELDSFLDYDFFATHEYITLELLDGAQTWQVFSAHLASKTFNYKDIYFESNTEYMAYIKMFKTMSRFERDIQLTENDQIVTLVTDYHDLDLQEGYLLIHARRVN